jgi:CHAD domain-containing protein
VKPPLVALETTTAHEAGDLAPRIAAEFERRLASFTAASERMRTLHDEAAIHDVRVSARRLAAALDLWHPLLRPRSRKRARRRLRSLRRSLGRVRQAEVAFADLTARLAKAPPPVRLGAPDLVELLGRLVVRGRRRAARASGVLRTARITTPVRRTVRSITEMIVAATGASIDAHERLAALASKAHRVLRVAARLGEDVPLHTARIAVKKWRYASESYEAVGLPPIGADTNDLRGLQRTLGELHDRAMLRDLLLRETERRRRRGVRQRAEILSPLIATLEAERLERIGTFLALVQRMNGPGPRPSPLPGAAF